MCPPLQSAGGGEGSAGKGSLPHSAPERRELPPDSDGTRHWDPPLHPGSGGRWVHLSGVIFPRL